MFWQRLPALSPNVRRNHWSGDLVWVRQQPIPALHRPERERCPHATTTTAAKSRKATPPSTRARTRPPRKRGIRAARRCGTAAAPTSGTMVRAASTAAAMAQAARPRSRAKVRPTRTWTTKARTGVTAEEALMFDRIRSWFETRRRGKTPLQQNMEKALHLKEAEPQTNIPEHQTAHEGGVLGSQVDYSDTAVGKEPTYTPNLKRSHVARSGDA